MAFCHRSSHHAAQLLQIHRFTDVVKRARFQGFDRIFCRAIGRNHNGAFFASTLLQLSQHFQPQAVGQAHIADDGGIALFADGRARGRHRACGVDAITLAHQGQLVQLAQVGFVIDHQNMQGFFTHKRGW